MISTGEKWFPVNKSISGRCVVIGRDASGSIIEESAAERNSLEELYLHPIRYAPGVF